MMTPLDKTLKRSLLVEGIDYVLTLSPDALKLTRKGRRLGMELKWTDITSGESALAMALQASVGRFDTEQGSRPPSSSNATGVSQAATKPTSSRRQAVAARRPAKKQPRRD